MWTAIITLAVVISTIVAVALFVVVGARRRGGPDAGMRGPLWIADDYLDITRGPRGPYDDLSD